MDLDIGASAHLWLELHTCTFAPGSPTWTKRSLPGDLRLRDGLGMATARRWLEITDSYCLCALPSLSDLPPVRMWFWFSHGSHSLPDRSITLYFGNLLRTWDRPVPGAGAATTSSIVATSGCNAQQTEICGCRHAGAHGQIHGQCQGTPVGTSARALRLAEPWGPSWAGDRAKGQLV